MNHPRELLELIDTDEVLAAISPKLESHFSNEKQAADIAYMDRCFDLAVNYVRRHGLPIDPAALLFAAGELEEDRAGILTRS